MAAHGGRAVLRAAAILLVYWAVVIVVSGAIVGTLLLSRAMTAPR